MLFSVVIPLYNKVNQIESTVFSVLNQTLDHFELIVVDDGSTDGSGDVVRRIRDPRIRLIAQENAGEGAARNSGIEAASGSHVCFLDADDLWCPGFLAEVSLMFSRHQDAVVCATASDVLEPDGSVTGYSEGQIRWADRKASRLDYLACLGSGVYPVSSSCVSVRRAALQGVGGFDQSLRVGADIDMWVRLSELGNFYYSTKVLARYNRAAENRSVHQDDLLQKRLTFIAKQQCRVEEMKARGRSLSGYRTFLAQKAYEVYVQAKDPSVRSAAELALRPNLSWLRFSHRVRYQVSKVVAPLGR